MTDRSLTSNQLSHICSCTWVEGLREPGIDCPVHPRPTGAKERFRKVESNVPWRLVPCRLCGSPAELWQRWRRDDVWDSFGACTNLEDVDGEACLFHLPDDPHFYRDRKTDAVRHWNLMMGPRSGDGSAGETPTQYQCRRCGSSDVMPWPTSSPETSAQPEPVAPPENRCLHTWQSFDDGEPVQCQRTRGHVGPHAHRPEKASAPPKPQPTDYLRECGCVNKAAYTKALADWHAQNGKADSGKP